MYGLTISGPRKNEIREYDRTDRHRLTSWSMAKTVTAMLVGIAIDEGRIRSVDDLAAAYVPELAGTEYGRTSLRHLLQMSSAGDCAAAETANANVAVNANATVHATSLMSSSRSEANWLDPHPAIWLTRGASLFCSVL